MKKMNKAGVIGQLTPLVTGIAAIAITLVIAFLILAQVKDNATVTADANATAAVTATQNAMDDIPGWLPIIIVALIGSLLLGIVKYFRSQS